MASDRLHQRTEAMKETLESLLMLTAVIIVAEVVNASVGYEMIEVDAGIDKKSRRKQK